MLSYVSIIVFVLGFVLVLQSGSILVELIHFLCNKFKISPALMGAVFLSFITTLPEILVAVIATLNGNYELSIGNAVGSVMCNFSLVLAISFLLFPKSLKITGLKMKFASCCVVVLFFIVFITNKRIGLWEGICLVILFILYLIVVFRNREKGEILEKSVKFEYNYNIFYIILQFIVCICAMLLGARCIVENVSKISQLLSINEKFIGYVIIAIGTSLPELVTVICSARNGYPEMGIGNMVGANIINLSFIIGGCASISKGALSASSGMVVIATVFLIAASLVTILPLILLGKSSRFQGLCLLFVYVFYVLTLYFIM